MKKEFFVITFCCVCSILSAQSVNPAYQAYIEQYRHIAIEQQRKYNVPAAITMAQAILESAAGTSQLAIKGCNHFGIKCHNNWQGGRMYHDDDRKGECFRKYDSPEQSYRDHSDFLRYRDRYKFLFDYDVTDYKAWAHGLKKAGYATDPAYPSKLIRLIEEYKLHEYDLKPDKKSDRKSRKKAKDKAGEQVADVLPEPPLQIEAPKRMAEDQRHVFRFNVAREVYVRNGVPYVLSVEGDTYEGLAASNNLFLREILKFNDLSGLSPCHRPWKVGNRGMYRILKLFG